MRFTELIAALSVESTRNHALAFLEEIIVDLDERLVDQLVGIIRDPASVEDTNRFASLIADLGAEAFIAPLIDTVSRAPTDAAWLPDYLYALVSLLDDREGRYPAEERFVRALGSWLLSTGGGELSWKAAHVLAELDCPATREYLVRGALDAGLFELTRISCLRGLVNCYPDEARRVTERMLADPEERIRAAASEAQSWLSRSSA